MFPEPKRLLVDSKGRISFTSEQWKFLLKLKKSKAKTLAAQKRIIRKIIIEAIKLGKKLSETNSH